MKVYRGERRYLAVDLAAVLAVGDALAGTPTVIVKTKRGRIVQSGIVMSSPIPPATSGTEVRFWVDIPDEQVIGNYLAVVECPTGNGERIVEEAPLIVQ